MKKNANIEQSLDTVSPLALVLRIIPIILILTFLFYKDLRRGFKGFKSFFNNLYLFSGLLFVIVSIFSAFVKSNSIFSVWKSIELLTVLYVTSSLYSLNLGRVQSVLFFEKIFGLFKLLLIFTGISALIFPQYAFHPKIIQLFSVFPKMNPNSLGTFSLITLSYCVYRYSIFKKDIFFVIYIALLYVLALSRTAYISGTLILSLILLQIIIKLIFSLKTKKNAVYFYALSFLFVSIILPFGLSKITNYVTKGQSTEQLSTMSSRTLIWTAAWLSIKESPLLGYGVYAETKKLNIKHVELFKDSRKKNRGISNTHNSYVDILLGAGILGGGLYIILFLYNVIRSIFYLILSRRSNLSMVICAVIIAYFFRFLTGGGYAGLAFESMTYFLIIGLRLLPWTKKLI